MSPLESDVMLTTKETAALLKVRPETVRRWAREGKLPGYRIEHTLRFSRQDVLEFAEIRERQEPTPAEQQISAEVVMPSRFSRRTLLKGVAAIAGTVASGWAQNEFAEAIDPSDIVRITPFVNQWIRIANEVETGQGVERTWRKEEAREAFVETFLQLDASHLHSLSLGRTYGAGYHPDNAAAARALLAPLGLIGDAITHKVHADIPLPQEGNLLLIGGPTSTPLTAIAFEFDGPSRDVQRRPRRPIVPLPYYGFSDISQLGQRDVGWILEGGGLYGSPKSVASFSWLFICTAPNDRQPLRELRPTLSNELLTVDGQKVRVPSNNFLLITKLPNFLDQAFDEMLRRDSDSWPRLVIFDGTNGLGTRAVELLLETSSLSVLDQITDQLNGANDFQVIVEVGEIDSVDGFHRANKVKKVVDVRPLNFDRVVWRNAYNYAQHRLARSLPPQRGARDDGPYAW